jgi:hypothetical protein
MEHMQPKTITRPRQSANGSQWYFTIGSSDGTYGTSSMYEPNEEQAMLAFNRFIKMGYELVEGYWDNANGKLVVEGQIQTKIDGEEKAVVEIEAETGIEIVESGFDKFIMIGDIVTIRAYNFRNGRAENFQVRVIGKGRFAHGVLPDGTKSAGRMWVVEIDKDNPVYDLTRYDEDEDKIAGKPFVEKFSSTHMIFS